MSGQRLSELLRTLRGGDSLRDAAKRIGVSHQYIKTLEDGVDPRNGEEPAPSPEMLRRISDGYRFPYEKLLEAAGYLVGANELTEEPGDGVVRVPFFDSLDRIAVRFGGQGDDARIMDARTLPGAGPFFLLAISGHEMKNLHLVDGGTALVRVQNFLADGEVGVLLVDGVPLIRQFNRGNGIVILSAANPDVKICAHPLDAVSVIGRIVRAEVDL